jgi:hypothetical protein
VAHVGAVALVGGKAARVHWMMYLVAAAFAPYFVAPVIEPRLG